MDYDFTELETFGIDEDNGGGDKLEASPLSPCSDSELIIDADLSEKESETKDHVVIF